MPQPQRAELAMEIISQGKIILIFMKLFFIKKKKKKKTVDLPSIEYASVCP